MAELETLTGGLRLLAHVLTFLAVGLWYRDPTARYRAGVSILAYVIAASSLALAIQQAIYPPNGARIFETVLIAAFALLVLRAGGNIALLLPRRPWSPPA